MVPASIVDAPADHRRASPRSDRNGRMRACRASERLAAIGDWSPGRSRGDQRSVVIGTIELLLDEQHTPVRDDLEVPLLISRAGLIVSQPARVRSALAGERCCRDQRIVQSPVSGALRAAQRTSNCAEYGPMPWFLATLDELSRCSHLSSPRSTRWSTPTAASCS